MNMFSAECASSLVISWFRTTIYSYLHNILVFYFTCLNNKNSNVELQFISLCRLQQLAMPSRMTVVLVSLLVATPVTIFWLWLMILPTSVTILCPEECRCKVEGYFVNCSSSRLYGIPSILPKYIRRLTLDYNKIPFFAKDNFVSKGLVELETIEADFCNTKKIEVGAFHGLPKLTHLSMQSNEISEIIPGTFEKNFRLEYLHLARNRIEHLEADIFYGLVNLKYILLQENKLQYFHPDTFLRLPNLQFLYLSNNYGLQIPTERHFINSLSLKHLGLSFCKIRSVSVKTFANVSELELLDLSYNYLMTLDINILKVLPNLSVLNLTRNEIREIIPGTFEMVSHLKDLDLSHNRIEHLEFDVFYGLVNLKYIYLQGNKLQYLHPDTFVGLPNLQKLYLFKNYGLQVPNDRQLFDSLSLKHLGLSGCNISSVSIETFANVRELEWLDLSYNYLRSLDINILSELPNLSHLNLKRNEITEIKPGTCDKISILEYLYLENNIIEHLEIDVFCGFVKLKYINLKGNNLQFFHPDTFAVLPNLQTLFLSQNFGLKIQNDSHYKNSHSLKRLGISGCNIRSVSVETFANVRELEWLDLSYNSLRSLDINTLKVLPKLSLVNLNRNQIFEIKPGTCEKISHLVYLYLKYNIIEHLANDVFCGFVHLKYIDLRENKLQYLHPDTFVGLQNLQTLILSHNYDLQVPTDSHFINSHSLKHLFISFCNIRSVSVETFANVIALEGLDLGHNKLKVLDINILKVLPKLSDLYLDGNEINKIIPRVFGNHSLLKHIELDNNKPEHLRNDVFYGMFNLKSISLKGNKLQYLHLEKFLGLPNLHSLDLSMNLGLHMPTGLHFITSLSLKQLDIAGCNISSVTFETFANVSELEQLDLSYNYLKILDINILKALPKLSYLYLRRNQISEIIPGTLEKNSFLEYLDLGHNIIEHLRSDVFNGLDKLLYITLEFNKLQYVHPETFVALPYLGGLDLSYNYALQIPTDRHFISSHSLKNLALSGCNISSVSVETFANVSALERLFLVKNNLKSLNINVLKALPRLSELYLKGNPLHCDCQLQEVWRWCMDHNIRVQNEFWLSFANCYTPSDVEGIWWGVLEKGQCLQGNIHYYGDYKNTRYSYTQFEDPDMDTDKKTDLNIRFVKWKKFRSYLDHYNLPICAVLFIFGTTGNVIIIIIITCNRDMRTVPNMYILNLVVSDIIHLTALLFATLLNYIMLSKDDIWCLSLTFCFRMPVILTAYSVALLSFQRYRVTVYSLQVCVSSQPTWRATGATICGLWIVAALFTIPSARTNQICGITVSLWLTNYFPLFAIFRLLVSCVLPLCVIAFCYIMTSRHLLKNCSALAEETQNSRLNKRKNTAKVVLGLTLVFLFTSMPFHIYEMCLHLSINLEDTIGEILEKTNGTFNYLYIMSILQLFLSINSCLNPVALFCTSLAFRRHFKRYLTWCCKTKSPINDFELRRRN